MQIETHDGGRFFYVRTDPASVALLYAKNDRIVVLSDEEVLLSRAQFDDLYKQVHP